MSQLLVEYPLTRPHVWDNPLARGADGVLRYGNLTPALTELLDLQVHAFGSREAVVEVGGPRLTYRELWHSASRIAGGLQEHGIGYGDRVAVHMPTGARWVQAFLGALLSGAVPVLVHDGLPEGMAERVIADSRADFVLGDKACATELPDGAAYIDDGAALGDLALLCYTSGSCTPKGVELTNENLLSAVRSVVAALDLPTDGLRNLVLLPLAHASGCVDQLLPTFAVGGTVVLARDTRGMAEAITAERVDMVSATPRIFAGLLPRLAELRADGLRTDGIARISKAGHRAERAASAVTSVDLTVELRGVFPAARQWSVWGATETSGIGLAVDDAERADSPDTAAVLGFPFGGTELALWGPRATAGHGELLCRGPNVTPRYWDDPTTTAARFTGTWFHTGDQVTIDADGLVRRQAVPVE
ncbi:long-chain fatty acid--CoA ligase [Nocardia implantans]|uniref:Long-chain fatty acid--CoA ligase n=1 Tax=Nocardia implantans TaxID=3108168 RepID=A0ABU6B2K5_9NOCA|nr:MULTISPECIES: long-chain fatty acid--CoA ligase [unclassified Nocardia]MBF6194986.1 long-chain fatty acid--CoA ligase [Nocardia beijingensis]MEA3530353.1 long-chain fatty acid--CoA ligase [Nocardia sp. CDC192]MEB3513787.1 long-chain fatty acid--CoA ligase [Nocardia sp. CDC186]